MVSVKKITGLLQKEEKIHKYIYAGSTNSLKKLQIISCLLEWESPLNPLDFCK